MPDSKKALHANTVSLMRPCSCWQVEELLQLDASNEEYQELAKSLEEVIELTEDLLREAAGGAAAPSQPGARDTMQWQELAFHGRGAGQSRACRAQLCSSACVRRDLALNPCRMSLLQL